MHDRHDLSDDQQWKMLEPPVPRSSAGRAGRPWADHRRVVDAVLWRTRAGAAWRDLPAGYGPWKTVYNRHRHWARRRDLGTAAGRAPTRQRHRARELRRRHRLHRDPCPPTRSRCLAHLSGRRAGRAARGGPGGLREHSCRHAHRPHGGLNRTTRNRRGPTRIPQLDRGNHATARPWAALVAGSRRSFTSPRTAGVGP